LKKLPRLGRKNPLREAGQKLPEDLSEKLHKEASGAAISKVIDLLISREINAALLLGLPQ
jgi:hypothetical protein